MDNGREIVGIPVAVLGGGGEASAGWQKRSRPRPADRTGATNTLANGWSLLLLRLAAAEDVVVALAADEDVVWVAGLELVVTRPAEESDGDGEVVDVDLVVAGLAEHQ